MKRASDLTLLDIADRLLDTGVSLTGEATISVADVDLVYLGLDVVLASVEKMRGTGNVPIIPFPKWPDGLSESRLPGAQTEARSDEVEHPGPREGFARPRVGRKARPPGAQIEARSDEVEHPGPREGFARPRVGTREGFARPRVGKGPGAMSAATYPSIDAVSGRIDVDPDEVERGLAKLVLTIVEFIRQLLERQAVRRMDGGSLTEEQVERMGTALMRLEEKVGEMAKRFGLAREELRLGLGPLGELL